MPTDECELTYATVCSGIECMSAAVAPLGGWRPVFFSEIEPFPCALLKHRYPTVPNLGDMTKIKAEKIGEEKWRITNGTDAVELAGRLGCLAGGTPCQDVSVAGKRAGMAEGSGTRSSLAFHFARLCRELQPRWVLWENVPGVLTSNGGRDFAHFARAVGECGYSLAYRVLDAQWVRVDGLPRGVPQRRRRVWLVGHLGDDWRTPAEVLFEPQGVRGDSPPRRVTGQGASGAAGGGAEGADRPLPTNSNGGDVMPALTSRDLEARLTVGKYSKHTENLYVVTGFNKWGMTSSMVAAEILKDEILGAKNDYAEIFDPSRSMMFKQLGVNVFESVSGMLTPTTKRCPHLGCGLKWNRQEHTWDCSCHGSRFDADGSLIDNPAKKDLSNS